MLPFPHLQHAKILWLSNFICLPLTCTLLLSNTLIFSIHLWPLMRMLLLYRVNVHWHLSMYLSFSCSLFLPTSQSHDPGHFPSTWRTLRYFLPFFFFFFFENVFCPFFFFLINYLGICLTEYQDFYYETIAIKAMCFGQG